MLCLLEFVAFQIKITAVAFVREYHQGGGCDPQYWLSRKTQGQPQESDVHHSACQMGRFLETIRVDGQWKRYRRDAAPVEGCGVAEAVVRDQRQVAIEQVVAAAAAVGVAEKIGTCDDGRFGSLQHEARAKLVDLTWTEESAAQERGAR